METCPSLQLILLQSYFTDVLSGFYNDHPASQDLHLTPAGIIRKLQLRRPIYSKAAWEDRFGVEEPP